MKRWMCALALLVLSSSACGVVKVKKPEEPSTLRSKAFNVGFEEGDPGDTVPGWRQTGGYEIELVEDVQRSGKQSARITEVAGEVTWGALNQDFTGDSFAGKTVTVRAWIKVEGTEVCAECDKPGLDESTLPEGPRRGAQVRILGYGPNNAITSETLVTPLVMGTKDWTRFEAVATMPMDINNAIIAPILWGPGTAWFDDIVVSAK